MVGGFINICALVLVKYQAKSWQKKYRSGLALSMVLRGMEVFLLFTYAEHCIIGSNVPTVIMSECHLEPVFIGNGLQSTKGKKNNNNNAL